MLCFLALGALGNLTFCSSFTLHAVFSFGAGSVGPFNPKCGNAVHKLIDAFSASNFDCFVSLAPLGCVSIIHDRFHFGEVIRT
jgi:hypothetical protein